MESCQWGILKLKECSTYKKDMIHKICKTLKEEKIKAQMINMSYV